MTRLLGMGMVFLVAFATFVQAGEPPLTVTAKLMEIPSKFPPEDLYDYAYVMKYEVTDGPKKGQVLYVGHYKPTRARSKIDGEMKKHVSGKVRSFKVGKVHTLKLVAGIDKIWEGAVIDDFFATDRKSTRYWCLEANPAP